MHYYRKSTQKNKIVSLSKTSKFKLSLKNKLHNLFLNSINFAGEELTILYESDPFFNKFDTADIIKTHRRTVSLANTFQERQSIKTRGSSRDSRPEEKPAPARTNKNSLFNTFISGTDPNSIYPSRGSGLHTNKSSFAEGPFYPNQLKPRIESRKSTIPECSRANGNLYDNLTSQEEFTCESMIIHDSKDNDDYIKRICTILAENLENSATHSLENQVASPEEFSKKKNSMEHSKIFDLLKSQDRRDSTTVSTKPKYHSPDFILETVEFSPDKDDKDDNNFIYDPPKIEKNIMSLLDETINEETNKKKLFNSPIQDKENIPKRNKEKAKTNSLKYVGKSSPTKKVSPENTNKDSRYGLKRKPLQDISNKPKSSPKQTKAVPQRFSLDMRRTNPIFTSESSEKNLDLLTEIQETPIDNSKVTSRKPKADFNLQLNKCEEELFCNEDLFCDEELVKPTPRYTEVDFKTYMSPQNERLHTVEEVCSSSKESSTGGEYPIRSFASRSTNSKRDYLTSSARVLTDVKFSHNLFNGFRKELSASSRNLEMVVAVITAARLVSEQLKAILVI